MHRSARASAASAPPCARARVEPAVAQRPRVHPRASAATLLRSMVWRAQREAGRSAPSARARAPPARARRRRSPRRAARARASDRRRAVRCAGCPCSCGAHLRQRHRQELAMPPVAARDQIAVSSVATTSAEQRRSPTEPSYRYPHGAAYERLADGDVESEALAGIGVGRAVGLAGRRCG